MNPYRAVHLYRVNFNAAGILINLQPYHKVKSPVALTETIQGQIEFYTREKRLKSVESNPKLPWFNKKTTNQKN